jgi:transposase
MATLHAGFDLSLKTIAVCLMLEDGREPLPRFTIDHSPAGVDAFIDRVLKVAVPHEITQLQVGMESTGAFAEPLFDLLGTAEALRPFDPKVYRLDAKQVAHFKKVYAETSKTDPADAFIIAERLRFGRLPDPVHSDERYLALQKLTRHRFHLAHTLIDEKNRFLSSLFLKFSAFAQKAPFSDTFGATSGALLTEFLSTEEIAAMSVEDLATFLQEKGRNHFADPPSLARVIKQAAKNSYQLSDCLSNPVNLILAMTMENIRFFEKQIGSLDRAIERELSAFPLATVLLSVPGIGPVLTSGLLAEIQEIDRFEGEAQLARYAGLAWKEHQSGEFHGDETPLLHSGNQYLRYYLVEAANTVRMHNAAYRAYYETKYRESHAHHHKRALVLTARKLVRLIYALLQRGQLYQPSLARKEDPAADATAVGEIARQVRRRKAHLTTA